VQLHEDRLEQPLHWKTPRRVFVNSLSDLFHPDVPNAFIDRVFFTMALAPQHRFQVLTKRPDRMRDYIARFVWSTITFIHQWPLPNVWLGVSVENQHFADERIPLLLQTPAAVRFISAEPLLGPVDLEKSNPLWAGVRLADGERWTGTGGKLDWVIVGGESGPGARPFDLAWGRSIVSECRRQGVPCFVKQLGAFATQTFNDVEVHELALRDKKGGDPLEWPEDLRVREFPTMAVPA
jgi:protein gp37